MGHNGGIDAYPGVQQEVLPVFTRLFGLFVYLFGFSCLSSLPHLLRLLCLFVFLALGLFTAHGMSRDSQARDLEEAEVNFASNAIDKGKGCLYRVARYVCLTCPFIEGSPRNIAYDSLAPRVQHSIDDGVDRAITTIANHHVMTISGGLLGQL